ncbi:MULTISPECIES: hypothetical protein [Eikenella]|uniref:Uncharacterized protein n=1 Tax=Eikenella exigua TaxID=2528037 RepID=A0AAX1F667_9NEIS|nr:MULTISPECIES: hypothetical protein [Eikenella]OAM28085.1 hypothetical protein A7P94_05010 [Eikenella sp. NML01-A-086]OAM42821.1 hypothetical protein A7Q02_03345 [Eikenella sp. NML97-A-109]QED91566.1 hypothetical protein EZJ17_02120 [Eikenella exigua]
MGFISEIYKDDDKYILITDVILLVQSLDSDNPSLKETAKFLLQKYEESHIDDIPFRRVDEICFIKNVSGRYEQVDYKKPLLCFLEFVVIYGCLDDGVWGDDPTFVVPNKYLDTYLEKKAVVDFLKNTCGLKYFQAWEGSKPEIQTTQPDHKETKPAESTPASTPQQRRAENTQAEIIAALACMYTKTDCGKPYEAAETIRQEWERQADKLGKPPSTDTISKYISRGMERLSR